MNSSDYVYYWLCKIFGTYEEHVQGFGDPEWIKQIDTINANLIHGIQQTHDMLSNNSIIISKLANMLLGGM